MIVRIGDGERVNVKRLLIAVVLSPGGFQREPNQLVISHSTSAKTSYFIPCQIAFFSLTLKMRFNPAPSTGSYDPRKSSLKVDVSCFEIVLTLQPISLIR